MTRRIRKNDHHRVLTAEQIENRSRIALLRAEGHTIKEIADKVGVSCQRVQQLLQDILECTGEPVHTAVETMGDRLKYARTAAGLTAHEVQNRTGVHHVSIYRAEGGTITMQLENLLKLVELYGVDAHWLLFGRRYVPSPLSAIDWQKR